jgi:hypothetical protein
LRHALPDLPAERYQDVALRYRHHYLARIMSCCCSTAPKP